MQRRKQEVVSLCKMAENMAVFAILIHPQGSSELQIREDIEDNSKIIFLLYENIFCDPLVGWF